MVGYIQCILEYMIENLHIWRFLPKWGGSYIENRWNAALRSAIEQIAFGNAHRTQNAKQSAHCTVLRKLIERLDKTSGGNSKLPLIRKYGPDAQGVNTIHDHLFLVKKESGHYQYNQKVEKEQSPLLNLVIYPKIEWRFIRTKYSALSTSNLDSS